MRCLLYNVRSRLRVGRLAHVCTELRGDVGLLTGARRQLDKGGGGCCGLTLSSEHALRFHQVRVRGGGHGLSSPLASCVICHCCPFCRTTFSSIGSARQRTGCAWQRGWCKTVQSVLEWELVPPPQLKCPFCSEFALINIDALLEHRVEVRLPRPRPGPIRARNASSVAQRGGRRVDGLEVRAAPRTRGRQRVAFPQAAGRRRRERRPEKESRHFQG